MVAKASPAPLAREKGSRDASISTRERLRADVLPSPQTPGNDAQTWQPDAGFGQYVDGRIRAAFRQAVVDPLANVSGVAAQLTHQGAAGDQVERMCEDVSRIDRSVQDLLEFTLISLGHGLQLRRRRIHLDLLCERVLDAIGRRNPDHRIVFVSEPGIEGEWDPDRVASLLARLVASAMSCPDRHRMVRVSLRSLPDAAIIEVVHSGQSLERAFVPFAVDSSAPGDPSASRDGGLGLDLYLAREIARAHGGRIDVLKNRSGGGSLSVTLPRNGS
jgi:signal transduction histidine kinase